MPTRDDDYTWVFMAICFRGLPNHTRVQKERAITADKITPKTRQTLTSRPTNLGEGRL